MALDTDCVLSVRISSHFTNQPIAFQIMDNADGLICDTNQCYVSLCLFSCCDDILHSVVYLWSSAPFVTCLRHTRSTAVTVMLSKCASTSTSHHPEPPKFVVSLRLNYLALVSILVPGVTITPRTTTTSF